MIVFSFGTSIGFLSRFIILESLQASPLLILSNFGVSHQNIDKQHSRFKKNKIKTLLPIVNIGMTAFIIIKILPGHKMYSHAGVGTTNTVELYCFMSIWSIY